MATPPSREGKKQLGVHVDPSVKEEMRVLAFEQNTTVQYLMEEALVLLFEKYGKKSSIQLEKRELGVWSEAGLRNHKSRPWSPEDIIDGDQES